MQEEDALKNEMKYLDDLVIRYPVLDTIRTQILGAYEILRDCYEADGKLLIAGNGGSCADSEHMVGELMKGFLKRRPVPDQMARRLAAVDPERGELLAKRLQRGLPAIALTGHNALTTAFANDVNGDMGYAQQLYGYGRPGDVFLGISTSGNAENVMFAVTAAKALGMKTIGLTGRDGGALGRSCNVAIIVPEQETFKIQELHLPVYHALCLMLEEHFYEV